MSDTRDTARVDTEQVRRALELLVAPGGITEIRILNAGKGGVISGYFDKLDAATAAVIRYSGAAPAIYLTPNEANPDLLARASNRLKPNARTTTTDPDITRRRWLLLDFDPARPAGISSTEAEHAGALARAQGVGDFLAKEGWPAGILADSGNGAHLLYRIDLPNDDTARRLIERCLKSLDFQFSDDAVKVDTGVGNAARIWKLYGTLACKGDNTPERPHRLAQLLEVPSPIEIVTQAQLDALAAQLPPESAPKASRVAGPAFNLEAWITTHLGHCHPQGPAPWRDAQKWILSVCPWNPEHDNRAAFIILQPNGAISAGCHHNGCAGNDWQSLRERYEPGCYERKESLRDHASGQDSAPPPGREPPPIDAYADDPEARGQTRDKGAGEPPGSNRQQSAETDTGDSYPPLPCAIFTFEDFEIEPPDPPFIIAGLMPQDVCMLNATGGTGKSTFELFRSIHIILGLDFFGMPIERPGPVLYITAEDGKERIHRRLYWIMRAMNLTPAQRRRVAQNFRVVDLCEYPLRLITVDKTGALVRTSLIERIITEYRGFAPVVIYFDPFVRFSPGEEYGNDGGDHTISAMLTLTRALSCATSGIHHVSKAVFRDGTIDHHSGRGPSSIGDGARCVYSLLAVEGENKKLPGITAAYQHHIDAGELMALFVPKLTDCKPIRDPFIIRRNGWRFDLLKQPTPESIEAARKQAHQDKVKQNLDKLIAYLKEWNLKHHAKADLEEARADMGLSRDDVREAIRVGLREHSLVERELPESEKTRTRRHGIYLGRDWQ